MKIAVVGGGISGLIAAQKIQEHHEVYVFEQDRIASGHIKTKNIEFLAPDGTKQTLNADLGVFMFERGIHPHFFALAEQYNLALEPFNLTSALENDDADLYWSSHVNVDMPFRHHWIYLKSLWRGIKYKKGKYYHRYFIDLARFNEHSKRYRTEKKYLTMSHQEFIEQEKFTPALLESWLYPQLSFWWGSTKESVKNSSIAMFADSVYDIANGSSTYIMKNGAVLLPELLAREIKNITLNSRVTNIAPKNNKVELTVNNEKLIFDKVILAVKPKTIKNILQIDNADLFQTLSSFDTTTTTIYLHTDTKFMPSIRKEWAIANMLNKHDRGQFSTFWVGGLHNYQPDYFISWGEGMDQLDQDKILTTEKFLRCEPTFSYVDACEKINQFQGNDNIWFCGAHINTLPKGKVPSLWLDSALCSGIKAAEAVI